MRMRLSQRGQNKINVGDCSEVQGETFEPWLRGLFRVFILSLAFTSLND